MGGQDSHQLPVLQSAFMSRPPSGSARLRQQWLSLLISLLIWPASGCNRTAPSATLSQDAGRTDLQAAADAGTVAATWSQASPDVLVYSAALAMAEGDRRSARTVLEAALKRLQVQLVIEPVLGLREPPGEPLDAKLGASEVVRDLSASGSHLAVADRHLLSVVELKERYRTLRLAAHKEGLRDVVLSPNGHRVATLDAQQVVRLFALPTGSLIAELPLRSGPDDGGGSPARISFSPDSRWLLLADCGPEPRERDLHADKKSCALQRLRSIDAASGAVRGTLQAESELLYYTSRSDGNLMVLRAGEPPRFFDIATALEWPSSGLLNEANEADEADAKDGRSRGCLRPTPGPGLRSWAVSPDRRVMATLEPSKQLCVWELAGRSLKQVLSLRALGDKLRLHSLLAEGSGVLIAQADRALLLLNGKDGARRAVLPAGLTTFPLDDGGALLLPRARPRRGPFLAHRIELTAQGPRASSYSLMTPGAAAQAAELELGNVSGDGKYVFAVRPGAAPSSASAQLIELARPARLLPLPGQLSPRCCTLADFLDLNRRVVYADPAGNLRVHSIPDGALLYTTPMLQGVTSLHYRSADELLIGLGAGRSLQLWTSAGRLSWSQPNKATPDRAIIDKAIIDKATPDKALDALRRAAESRFFPNGATAWTVSPDGRWLLLAGAQGLLVWLDARSGALALRMQLALPGTQAAQDAMAAPGAVALSPAGRFELLGSVEDPDQYLLCRAGPYAVPSLLCQDWLGQSGMAASILRTAP